MHPFTIAPARYEVGRVLIHRAVDDVRAALSQGRQGQRADLARDGVEHRRRAVEWFLVLHKHHIDHAISLATTAPTTPSETATEPDDEPLGPTLYDTGLDATEGLWLRTGWAGRA